MVSQLLLLYRVGNKFSFIVIRHRSHEPDLFAFGILGEKCFFNLSFIIPDHLIGYVKNALRAAVVLFKLDHFHIVVVFLKLENVFDGSSAEAVDALSVITHHAHVLVHGAKKFYDLVLGGVGILVLVDKDVAELALVLAETFR